MMIEEIVSILRNDDGLTQLLNGNHVYASPCTFKGDCIVYNLVPVNADKIKATDKLEIQIITDTILKGAAIESRIKELLLTLGDEPLTANIREVYLNGGGSLFDEERQKNHKILYFYILTKE